MRKPVWIREDVTITIHARMLADVFLFRNGINLTATEVSAAQAVVDLAAGQMT